MYRLTSAFIALVAVAWMLLPVPASHANGGTSPDGEQYDAPYTQFDLAKSSQPYGIIAGRGCNLWFAEYATNAIGRVSTRVDFTAFDFGMSGPSIDSMAAGPGGNLSVINHGSAVLWHRPILLADRRLPPCGVHCGRS